MGTQQSLSELDSMKRGGGAFRSYRYATINRSWAGWQATLAWVRALPERGGTNKSGLSRRSLPMQRFFFCSKYRQILLRIFYLFSSFLFKFLRSLFNSMFALQVFTFTPQFYPFAPSSSLFSPVSISLSRYTFSREQRRFCRAAMTLPPVACFAL